jgi:hypothetical protein
MVFSFSIYIRKGHYEVFVDDDSQAAGRLLAQVKIMNQKHCHASLQQFQNKY